LGLEGVTGLAAPSSLPNILTTCTPSHFLNGSSSKNNVSSENKASVDIFLSTNLAGADGVEVDEEGVGGRDFVNTRGLRLSLLVTRLSLRRGAGGGICALASDETLRRLCAGPTSDERPVGASDERPVGASDERPEPTSKEIRLPTPASKANGLRPTGPEARIRPCPCPCPCAEAETRSDPPRTKPTRSEVKGAPVEAADKGTKARSVEGTEGTLRPLPPARPRLVYSAGGDG